MVIVLAIHNRAVNMQVLIGRPGVGATASFITMIDLYDHFRSELACVTG